MLILDLQLVFTEVLQNTTVYVLCTVDIKQSYRATMFVNSIQETSTQFLVTVLPSFKINKL